MPSTTTSKTYKPLELIYSEEAFAWVLPRRQKDEFCDYCCERADNLIPCEKCSDVKYCGTECQEKNANLHALECGKLRKLDDDKIFFQDFVRLLARVMSLLKDKDWKEVKRNVMGTDISFDDLNSRYEVMTTNPRLILLCIVLEKALKHFLGEEHLPKENLIKLIGKVKYNSGSFKGSSMVFCFGCSYFEHECIPNANVDSVENVLKIWAVRDIDAGSEKISISRRNILDTDLFRSTISNETYDVCECTECSLPYGESVLTKIINEEKAYVIIKWCEKVLREAESLLSLDMEDDPKLKALVEIALEKIDGVLGETNALHLKILALRVQMPYQSLLEKRTQLKKLQTIMSNIYGELNVELNTIYKALVMVNLEIGDETQVEHYLRKVTLTEGRCILDLS